MRSASYAALVVLLQGCFGDQASEPVSPPLTMAVAYQIDPGHSGVANVSAPVFPSIATWSASFSAEVSYPLIANGVVYILVGGFLSSGPTQLYALKKETGAVLWGPIAVGGTYAWAGQTYDRGQVFVANSDGLLRAFDANTGQLNWSSQLPSSSGTSAPSASNGVIYIGGSGSSGAEYAVKESDGTLIWSTAVSGGNEGSPAVSVDGLVISDACQTYGLKLATGTVLWHADLNCVGGLSRTVNLTPGLVYIRGQGQLPSIPILVRSAASGALLGSNSTLGSSVPPSLAVTSTAAYMNNLGRVQRLDPMLQTVKWTFGDGTLVSAPIVIDQSAIVASSSGLLYAIDVASGTQTWSVQLPAGVSAPDEQSAVPLTGLAAAEGYLVVPAGATLTAWNLKP